MPVIVPMYLEYTMSLSESEMLVWMLAKTTLQVDFYLRTLDSSVSKSMRKRIPTEIRVWKTALMYLGSGSTNSDELDLNNKENVVSRRLFQRLREEEAGERDTIQPRMVKNCKTAISGSSMCCGSEESDMHAITRQHRRWNNSLWSTCMTNSQKELIPFIPAKTGNKVNNNGKLVTK